MKQVKAVETGLSSNAMFGVHALTITPDNKHAAWANLKPNNKL